MPKLGISNDRIADTFDHVADLLEAEGGNSYRIRSYRTAAATLRSLEDPAERILREQGEDGLERLPGIGRKLAGSIREIVETGQLGLADRLEDEVHPGQAFTQVPGVGPELAHRIHDQLGIETLAELEIAAHDGRIQRVPGIGPKKADGIRNSLAGLLSRSARRDQRQALGRRPVDRPPVDLLLDLDEQYRRGAASDQLPKITPKRFNPRHESWLPIMKLKRDDWSFTLLFSNTARAHEQDKTRDWVVIYYEQGGNQDQCTAVTAERGPLAGKRVIRGREKECRRHYGE